MGARQREEANARAHQAGRKAFQEGHPRDSNPYKRPAGRGVGEWSLHPAWDYGWSKADQETKPPPVELSKPVAAEMVSKMEIWAEDPDLYEGDGYTEAEADNLMERVRSAAELEQLDITDFTPRERITLAEELEDAGTVLVDRVKLEGSDAMLAAAAMWNKLRRVSQALRNYEGTKGI